MIAQVRSIIRQHDPLSRDIDTVGDDTDLYASGLTSHASVNLMLALEDAFGIEFPERLLRRRTFETIANIRGAIEELHAVQPTAAH
ncbi:MAG: acyl carrier protein [Gemmatimonadaceae bacterium]